MREGGRDAQRASSFRDAGNRQSPPSRGPIEVSVGAEPLLAKPDKQQPSWRLRLLPGFARLHHGAEPSLAPKARKRDGEARHSATGSRQPVTGNLPGSSSRRCSPLGCHPVAARHRRADPAAGLRRAEAASAAQAGIHDKFPHATSFASSHMWLHLMLARKPARWNTCARSSTLVVRTLAWVPPARPPSSALAARRAGAGAAGRRDGRACRQRQTKSAPGRRTWPIQFFW